MSTRREDLPALWHTAPRRWGHKMHSMCSYMAMFPPSIPHVFIRWLTDPGDVVFDPFCGRGTTVFEAGLLGRIGLGADANPLATILTAAKTDVPRKTSVARRLVDLGERCLPLDTFQEHPDVRMLFHKRTLGQLLWLKQELDTSRRVDRFLLATLLGILHLNSDTSGAPRGLSVSMPNTFAMSPGYVRKFISKRGLIAPDVDVIEKLFARVKSLDFPGRDFVRGQAWLRDASRPPPARLRREPAKLVFTSPPYLEVMLYGKFNWIRLWMLGLKRQDVDGRLLTTGSLPRYLDFMKAVLVNLSAAIREDGFLCLVIGDVRRETEDINLAQTVADECLAGTDFRLVDIIEDRLPTEHKVSRIWKETKGRATKTDRIIVLAKPSGHIKRVPRSIVWN